MNADLSARAMHMSRQDRRVLRTQAALQQALLSLMLRKEYDAITIEELCEQANVGRSTFYEYFRGKDDLKRSGIARLAQDLRSPVNSSETQFAFMRPVLQHAREYRSHFRSMGRGRAREISLEALRRLVKEQVARELESVNGSPRLANRALTVEYFTGAFMAVLIWWLDSAADLPVEEAEAALQRLAAWR